MDISKFKDIFISEAEDHLQKLNDNLLVVERTVKQLEKDVALSDLRQQEFSKLLDELMRSAHTLKSSSATMGYAKMAFFTHILEDVFDHARNGILTITSSIINEMFPAFDKLNQSLENIKTNNEEIDLGVYSQKIKELTGVATEGIGKSKRDESGKPVAKKKSDPEIVKNIENEEDNIEISKDKVEEVVEKTISSTETVSHIKVPVGRLDNLMDLTEELLIDKMKVASIIDNELKKEETIADISRREAVLNFKPVSEHLSSIVSNLQYHVMQARLVPVGQIFARFPRMVRDLALQENKEVDLQIKGEDLELDRSIIDKLGQPLVHLLRNAVDHGIEKIGIIKLEALREKEFVTIVIEDNGAGIDWQRVVESAVEKNILDQKVGERYLSELKADQQNRTIKREMVELLFHPRLSTNKKVTETSGRGVGLSVVQQFVESIAGNIIVESPINENGGTRFILELPQSLAIIDVLLVKIEEATFAIPFPSIQRVVSVESGNIKSMADQDVAVIDGIRVPLVPLDKVLGISKKIQPKIDKNVDEKNEQKDEKLDKEELSTNEKINKEQKVELIKEKNKTVVLVKRGEEQAGIVIEEVMGEQEIIVKPLPTILHGIKGFSGSTILGDGETILILDIISLLQDSSSKLIRV